MAASYQNRTDSDLIADPFCGSLGEAVHGQLRGSHESTLDDDPTEQTRAHMRMYAYEREVTSPPPVSIARGAELLKTLGSPVRLGVILQLQAHGEQCVHELVASPEVSQPLISQHLRVLRDARLVVGRRAGKEIRYSIADDHVSHIVHDVIRHAEEELP